MRLANFWMDDESEKDRCLHIKLVAESQKDAAELVEICNAMPKAIEAYGAVGNTETWGWFKIRMKRVPYGKQYFGYR